MNLGHRDPRDSRYRKALENQVQNNSIAAMSMIVSRGEAVTFKPIGEISLPA